MRKRLGEFLVDSQVITREQLEECLSLQGGPHQKRLGKILVEKGYAKEVDIANSLASKLILPFVDLRTTAIDPEAVSIVDEKLARRHHVFPFRIEGRTLHLAMSDPLDIDAIENVRFHSGYEVSPAVALADAVGESIHRHYNLAESLDNLLGEATESVPVEVLSNREASADEIKLRRMSEALPVVRLVNLVFAEAVRSKASDVHLEPGPDKILVRTRVDGILKVRMKLPKWVQAPMISRIKIMANLDITEKRLPQDGRLQLRVDGVDANLRVSTLPARHGEKLVIRVLRRSTAPSLDGLGMDEGTLVEMRELVRQPQGVILVTGPTGSGKTTSLYAALRQMDLARLNVVTLEDPIEYEIAEVNQVQINEKAGLTFAAGLRSVLRQDPDVIFVGEIRDEETTSVAFKASLTGHLVISTLHTNSAFAAVTRLIDMGLPSYLVGSALTAVVAQRLIRTICEECKVSYTPEHGELAGLEVAIARVRGRTLRPKKRRFRPEGLGESRHLMTWIDGLVENQPQPVDDEIVLYRGKGCTKCAGTGYSRRTGVYEVLRITPAVREMIFRGASEDKIRRTAEQSGMKTLLQQACTKLVEGETTVEELIRVVATERENEIPCERCGAALDRDFAACPFCGLSSLPTCGHCGRRCDKEWTFCAYCRAELKTVAKHPRSLGLEHLKRKA